MAQALIALQRYAITAFAWVAGLTVFVVLMVVLPVDIFTRAEIAFVAAGFVAVVWMSLVAWRATSLRVLAEHSP